MPAIMAPGLVENGDHSDTAAAGLKRKASPLASQIWIVQVSIDLLTLSINSFTHLLTKAFISTLKTFQFWGILVMVFGLDHRSSIELVQ